MKTHALLLYGGYYTTHFLQITHPPDVPLHTALQHISFISSSVSIHTSILSFKSTPCIECITLIVDSRHQINNCSLGFSLFIEGLEFSKYLSQTTEEVSPYYQKQLSVPFSTKLRIICGCPYRKKKKSFKKRQKSIGHYLFQEFVLQFPPHNKSLIQITFLCSAKNDLTLQGLLHVCPELLSYINLWNTQRLKAESSSGAYWLQCAEPWYFRSGLIRLRVHQMLHSARLALQD